MAKITGNAARDFRIQFQQAREGAVKDAEAFEGIIHVVERLGSFCLGRVECLDKYYEPLWEQVARLSWLADHGWRNVHTPFRVLYTLVKDARNDAMHQGASARHLTTHAIELALVFEDALRMIEKNRKGSMVVSDYMVRDLVCADLWQPISLIRQRLLTNSFTYLPVEEAGQWCLLSDVQVAKYLQEGCSNTERKERLAEPLETAGFKLCPAKRVNETMSIDKALEKFDDKPIHEPILVFRDGAKEGDSANAKPVGILTAFDLL
jgi:CBS domain containing-hemolysin-like protein